MPLSTQITQVLSISSSLLAAGGIISLSIFDFPEFRSQPGERSLPSVRWLFSRGSHIFPQAALISSVGFSYLAYSSLPAHTRSFSQLLRSTNGLRVNGYLGAALLAISIYPFTRFVMLPNNFALMEKNEKIGGARSQASAKKAREVGFKGGERSVAESVSGKGEGEEFSDLSLPQEKTEGSLTESEQEEVREMMVKFEGQNLVRAGLIGAGGVLGLIVSIA